MHGIFERCLERKNNDLFLAVGTHNSEAFWPQTDDSADQNEKWFYEGFYIKTRKKKQKKWGSKRSEPPCGGPWNYERYLNG